jgi:hypothetical protein
MQRIAPDSKQHQIPHSDRPLSRTARLAAFFESCPNEWIDGRLLEFAGRYAWRTRLSELRFPPYSMRILNRQRHVLVGEQALVISEYKFEPESTLLAQSDTNMTTEQGRLL